MSLVIVGHVDHGKSTLVGRLLADTGSLPTGKLDQVREHCLRTERPFEFAFLLDALKDEQRQGLTIDSARVFFRTERRHYIVIDAPGHVDFLKNMVSGAARAEAALLLIDAAEGLQENSYRHGYLLSFLGIRQVGVIINKMDRIGFDPSAFQELAGSYGRYLASLEIDPVAFIPVSAFEGDNVVHRSTRTPWYEGPTVAGLLDRFQGAARPLDRPFRMPLQDVYKFTRHGDDRRIFAGTIESGRLRAGDEIVFYPGGKRTRVATIESFGGPEAITIEAGQAGGFTVTEQVYVPRGQLVARADEPAPRVASRLRATVFWMGRRPMVRKREYLLKLGTARVRAELEEIVRIIDATHAGNPGTRDRLDRHEVAECILALAEPIAFERATDDPGLSRFVVVDEFDIRGGGTIQEALEDRSSWVREKVMLRNLKWEPSQVGPDRRAEVYNQRSTLILLSGDARSRRKEIAKALESRLFSEGKLVYYLGIGSLKYGVDADLLEGEPEEAHREHFRRLGEVAHILLDAGLLLIVTARDVTPEDLQLLKVTADPDRVEVLWIGDEPASDLRPDLVLPDQDTDSALARIKEHLQDRGILFRPRG